MKRAEQSGLGRCLVGVLVVIGMACAAEPPADRPAAASSLSRSELEQKLARSSKEGDRRDEAGCRILLGVLDQVAGDREGMLAQFERSHSLLRDAGDSFGAGVTALALGIDLKESGRRAAADGWLRRSAKALAAAAASSGRIDGFGPRGAFSTLWQGILFAAELPRKPEPEPSQLVRTLATVAHGTLGDLFLADRRWAEAAREAEQALTLSRGLSSELEVLSRTLQAKVARARGQEEEAANHFERILAASGGRECPGRQGRWLEICASTLIELAQRAQDGQRLSHALELWNSLIAAARRLDDPLKEAVGLLQSAGLLHARGDSAEARRRLTGVEALLPRVEQPEERFRMLAGLAASSFALGIHERAVRYATAALALEGVGPPEQRANLSALTALSRAALGDLAGAEEEAEGLARESAAAPPVGDLLTILGPGLKAQIDRESLRGTLAELQQAMAGGRQVLPPEQAALFRSFLEQVLAVEDPKQFPSVLQRFFAGARRQGVYSEEDLAHFEQLIDLALQHRYDQMAGEWEAFLEQKGRSSDPGVWLRLMALNPPLLIAAGKPEEAIASARRNVEVIESYLSDVRLDPFQLSSRLDLQGHYETLIALTAATGRREEAFAAAERSRARALLNLLGNRRLRPKKDGDPRLVRRAEELRQEILALEQRAPTTVGSGRSAMDTTLATLRSQYRALLRELNLRDPSYAQMVTVEAASLPQIQADLPPRTTLLAYFTLAKGTVAWVVDRESAHQVIVEMPREEIGRAVGDLRRTIESRRSPDSSRSPEILLVPGAGPPATDLLYTKLIAPVRPYLTQPNLILVPHGALHRVPFAALRNPEGGRYLVEDFTLTYAPSASALRLLGKRQTPQGGRALVLGDPESARTELPRLGGARREARLIGSLLRTAPLIGKDATEAALRKQGPEIDILHVAAHGVQDLSDPQNTFLALTPGDGHDGRLEMGEIFEELDLDEANLVVLSACETALGGEGGGDEILGLVRAFLYAGSPAVVASLWAIDDAASAALMEQFYRHYLEGLPAHEALRQAQLTILRQPGREAPYYWAAFTMTGSSAWQPQHLAQLTCVLRSPDDAG